MAVGFNDTQKSYDRLIKLIIQELDRLLDDLSQDKKKIKERRNTIAHEVHAQKMEFVADKKAEMVTKVEVAKFNNGSPYRIPTSSLQPLFALEVKLEQLIVQKINIERRGTITIKDDPARIDNEITIIKEIIAYLKDNAGSKGKRRGLTREAGNALHDKIKDVYDSVWTREEEAKLTATHFEPLKVEIENKVGQIIAQINAIIEKIPDAAQQREEEEKEEVPAKDALHVIEREAKYWMAAYDILKDLVAVARSNENLTKKIEEAKKLLKQLKTRERREQWRAPVSKIKKGLKSIELPEAEINRLLQQLKIFEGKTLIDTVNLEELLKNEEDVDWNEVKGEAETIMRDLQAALKIIEDLKAKLAVQQARAVEKSIARNRAKMAERKAKAEAKRKREEELAYRERGAEVEAKRKREEESAYREREALAQKQGLVNVLKGRQAILEQRQARRLAKSKNRPDFRGDKEKRTKAYQEAAAQKKATEGSIRRHAVKVGRDTAYEQKVWDRRIARGLAKSKNRPDLRGDKEKRTKAYQEAAAQKRAIEKSIARARARNPKTFDERKAERIRAEAERRRIAEEAIEAENTERIIAADRAREEAKAGPRNRRRFDRKHKKEVTPHRRRGGHTRMGQRELRRSKRTGRWFKRPR